MTVYQYIPAFSTCQYGLAKCNIFCPCVPEALRDNVSQHFSQRNILCEKTEKIFRTIITKIWKNFIAFEFCDVVWLRVVKTDLRQGAA